MPQGYGAITADPEPQEDSQDLWRNKTRLLRVTATVVFVVCLAGAFVATAGPAGVLPATAANTAGQPAEATLFLDPVTLAPTLQWGVRDDAGAAHARFEDTLESDGWTRLWVSTTGTVDRVRSMYAAGYLEGALTQARTFDHARNVFDAFFHRIGHMPQEIQVWMNDQLLWMREMAATPPPGEEEYWQTAQAVLAHLDGQVEGYNDAAPAGQALTLTDFLMLANDGDMEDIAPAANHTLHLWRYERRHHQRSFRCSALFRLTAGLDDVLHSHVTWDSFSSMVRVLKRYDLRWADGFQRSVALSSSPGFGLASIDDWYQTDAGLVVIETTNGLYNQTQVDMIQPHSVPSWMRSVVANLRATSGAEWTDLFAKHHSGTYNNGWYVLDLKRFEPGQAQLQPGLLTLLEEVPEFVEVQDITGVLQAQGYVASYNVPMFARVAAASGFNAMEAVHGADFSHHDAPRARIFRRDAPAVETLEDLKRLMRYNDFRHDPLSQHNPAYAISARFDLSDDPAEFSLDGGIDAKVATVDMARRLEFQAVNGPTHDQQPIFAWSDENEGLAAHFGQPQVWGFGWEWFTSSSD